MSRVQLALRVSDLEGSIAFYSKLFGAEAGQAPPRLRELRHRRAAAQARPDRGRCRRGHPPGPPRRRGRVHRAGRRCDRPAEEAGLATFEENDTSCCYALQDKVWVHGPGKEPWEVYVVKADAGQLGKSAVSGGDACCSSNAQEAELAPAAAGCACG